MNYIWIILLAVYIISPRDAFPGIIDDIFAGIALYYYLKRKPKQKQQFYDRFRQARSSSYTSPGPGGPLTIEEAYAMLGIGSGATLDEIGKAYKEKMIMSHPDKVAHLSEELQEKAKELTLRLNEAYELIKKGKG